MYRNLNAEIARQNMSRGELAKVIKKTQATVSGKMCNKIVWTLPEALAVRKALKCENIDIGELFQWSE
jgi:hypothetical protein